jgi:fumarate reductase flavoprotein subunit
LKTQAEGIVTGVRELLQQGGATETISGLRREMRTVLEDGAGIYRDEAGTQMACEKVAEFRQRYKGIEINDKSNVFNTDLQSALELRNLLDVAETITEGSLQRRESRGAHQRLDYTERDDVNFLKHTLCYRRPDGRPRVEYSEVLITRSQPGTRDYSGGKK